MRRSVALAVTAGLVLGVAAPGSGALPRPGPLMAMAATVTETSPAIKVMPLGDSITWGKGSQATRSSSYRADLRTRLTGAGMTVDYVGTISNGLPVTDNDHEGHPGWTIAQIAAGVDGWLTTYRPDVVLLHIGTNDVKNAAAAVGAPARLSALVDRIRSRAPAAHIFVAKITGSTEPATQARISTYNASIPYIVSRRGPRVHLVDQSTVGGLDLRDYLHPNDFGYTKMAYIWYRAMRTVFQPLGRPWPAGANPYAATQAYLCVNSPPTAGGKVACRWWELRGVAQKYTVMVAAHYAYPTVRGRTVKTLVRAHPVTRTRIVMRWFIRR